jgi:hypothetical protein
MQSSTQFSLPWSACLLALVLSARPALAQDDDGAGSQPLLNVPLQQEAAPEKPGGRRQKTLQLSVGRAPTSLDYGREADLIENGTEEQVAKQLQDWNFELKGYMRAAAAFGWGPRNDNTDGTQLHIPPRIVGSSSGRWEYASFFENPSLTLYANWGNPLISANIIASAGTYYDSSFRGNFDRIDSGVRQAYLVLKFPDAFGRAGGLALTVGAFSNRYGSAGREQVSTGYYGVYLFGRTHVTGESLTAHIDLNKDWELIAEHGIGAKLDVIPWLSNAELTTATDDLDYFEGAGPTPLGSNFVHHAHLGFVYDGWITMAAHYMTSWSPNDRVRINPAAPPAAVDEARLTTMGAEIHIDGDAVGNGYLGFAHADGKNLQPLSNGLQVLHGSNGRGFKETFFGERIRDDGPSYTIQNSTGTVDTLMFQYSTGLSQYLGPLPFNARELSVAIYGMANHAVSPRPPGVPVDSRDYRDVDIYKLKVGADVQLALFKFLTLSFRYDHMHPDLSDSTTAFDAISPRLFIRTTWSTREYVIMSYTHFFTGSRVYPSSPFSDLLTPDKDLVSLSATFSF